MQRQSRCIVQLCICISCSDRHSLVAAQQTGHVFTVAPTVRLATPRKGAYLILLHESICILTRCICVYFCPCQGDGCLVSPILSDICFVQTIYYMLGSIHRVARQCSASCYEKDATGMCASNSNANTFTCFLLKASSTASAHTAQPPADCVDWS